MRCALLVWLSLLFFSAVAFSAERKEEKGKAHREKLYKKKKKKTGVTLAIDDVFEAWHDDDESDSDSDSDLSSDSDDGEEDEPERQRRRRGRYCGILSVPFDFEAPDLGAAVARMLRSSLPASSEAALSSSSSAPAEEEEDGREAGGLPGESFFGVSTPGATTVAAVRMRRPAPGLPPLLPLLPRGRGRGRRALRARAAVAPRAVPSSFVSASASSPLFRRFRVLLT